MRFDSSLKISAEQAITVSAAGTTPIPFGAKIKPGLGGRGAFLMVTCDVTLEAVGAATLQIKLRGGDVADMSDAVDVLLTPAIAKASLVEGMAPIYIPIPPTFNYKNCDCYYVVATGPFTAGKLTARIVDDVQSWDSFPNAAGANFT